MNSIQTVAYLLLWVLAVGLAGLVLLLYRQVERAYEDSLGTQGSGMLAGVEVPDIEVSLDKKDQPFQFPTNNELSLLAFLSTECDACVKLIKALDHDVEFDGSVVGMVSGERNTEFPPTDLTRVRLLWLSHPPDVIRSFGASAVPMVYVLRGRTVLASKLVATAAGVRRLLAEASEYERAAGGPEGRLQPTT